MSLPRGTIVDRTWSIEGLVGEGTFCEVYRAVHSLSSEVCAIKVERESRKAGAGKLETECAVLAAMKDHRSFARRINSGAIACHVPGGARTRRELLIMTLLGPSLSEARKRSEGGRLAPVTALSVTLQLIRCIRALHDKGWVHRDIKSSNFVLADESVPLDSPRLRLCVIDFGLSRQLIGSGAEQEGGLAAGTHVAERASCEFRGSPIYASVNAHLRKDLGRRDDLWSLLYTTAELLRGSLPWRADCLGPGSPPTTAAAAAAAAADSAAPSAAAPRAAAAEADTPVEPHRKSVMLQKVRLLPDFRSIS